MTGELREFEVDVTIHETGRVVVRARSATEALAGIRSGKLSWDELFDRGDRGIWVTASGARAYVR